MPDWWIPAPGSFGRPKLALAVEPEQIRWRSRPGLRAITSLSVTASAATAQDLEHVPFRGNRNVL